MRLIQQRFFRAFMRNFAHSCFPSKQTYYCICGFMAKPKVLFHVMALLTVMVWAVTFVSSKLLLANGLPPAEIFFLRFALAYIGVLPFAPKRLWCRNAKHELLMLVLGVTGGSAYFLAENTALKYTYAGNVCLLVSSTPLLIALLSLWLGKNEKPTKRLVIGSVVAFAGVALVVANDWSHVRLKFAGDILALLAALTWAFYQLLIKHAYAHYSALFITRKVFAYGLLSILLYFAFFPPEVELSIFARPVVITNLLFLGLVASCACYLSWNVVIGNIGSVASSNYIYLQPLIAASVSAVVLSEPITWVMLLGMVLIVSGVYWSERR